MSAPVVADPAAAAAAPSSTVRVAAALRTLARREDLKAFVLTTPALEAVLRRAASRYVAGRTRDEALATARALATPRTGLHDGHRVTIDFMGEDTREAVAAREATDEFLALVDALGPATASPGRLRDASVSLDLSHIGLAVPGNGERLAREHLAEIAAAAGAAGREVIISMEDSARTDAILGIHAAVAATQPHVGITLQATLHRTPDDLARVLERPGRVRLVKGAYLEPADRAHPRGTALDAAYHALARTLVEAAVTRGRPCSIATHDASLHALLREDVRALTGGRGPAEATRAGDVVMSGPALQFEMLHGVTPERLDAFAADGFATRVYLVYGMEWWLYLCHRLAEHPPSLFDALADAVEAMPGIGAALEAAGRPAMIGSSARPGRR